MNEPEDDIDADSLQAEIDRSLSLAQNLVTSWITPSPSSKKSTFAQDLEKELKEYTKKPPRLGVGASIPDSGPSSQDAARLKSKLIGKTHKRTREEEPTTRESESEEESRVGAIRKKPRLNSDVKKPFDKQSTKEGPKGLPTLQSLPVTALDHEETTASGQNLGIAHLGPDSSPKKKKKKKGKHKPGDLQQPNMMSPTKTVEMLPNSPDGGKVAPVASSPGKAPSQSSPNTTGPSRPPVLNLDKPVWQENTSVPPGQGSKRKRRRKKKKKSAKGQETTGNL